MTHPNEEVARSEMEAALRGDVEGMLAHYTEDVILHYPGRSNALSGTYRGKDGLQEWICKIDALLGPGDHSPAGYMISWRAMTTLSNSSRWRQGGPTDKTPVGTRQWSCTCAMARSARFGLTLTTHMLSMRCSHSRPAESIRAYPNRLTPSSLDRSDLLGLLAPELAEHTLSASHSPQETNQLG
jgi:hypothetical protein